MVVETTPFDGQNIWRTLEERIAQAPQRDFLIWVTDEGIDRHYTYREFGDISLRVAAGLAQRGVGRGDRVIIHLENCPEFLFTWFACAALGAVAVTTNPKSSAEEFAYFATHSRAVGAVTQPRLLEMVGATPAGVKWVVSVTEDPVSSDRSGTPVGPDSRFSSLLGDPSGLVVGTSAPTDLMNILYTSGTTSRPKGVRWTHANALWGARVSASHEALTADDIHLVYLPLFHINGLCCQTLATLWVGGTAVLVSKWSTSRFWTIARDFRCTWLPLVPFTVQALLQMEPRRDHSLRAFSGRAVLPELARGFGVRMDGWFGMTETITQVIHSDPYFPTPGAAIGRPALEYGIRIAREDGVSVGPNEPGELLVRGRPGLSLFDGYLDDDVATAAAFDGRGYFRTGDVVRQAEDGVISFVERIKDIIKIGGETVAPAEIERVVLEVGAVYEAAVVARPHTMLDEVPIVFVTVKPGSDTADLEARIMRACTERLASFKVPRAVFVLDELPKTAVGKVRKVELRQRDAGLRDALINGAQ